MKFLFLKSLTLGLLLISDTLYAKDLTFGCVTKCDLFFHVALKRVASFQGHQIKILDLSQSYPNVDWEKLDAIILPGGADISPSYYLSAVESDLQEYTKSLDHLVKYSQEGKRRDPIEFGTMKEYFNNPKLSHLPVLGVCRGMQLLAVSQGIPLYVDIKTELGIRNRRFLYDRIHIEDGETLMNELFIGSFKAFKRHHQGIRIEYFNRHADRWPHLSLTSFSNKGLIAESLEFSDRPILGVQFHPENDFGFERNQIFGWLIKKALQWNEMKLSKHES